MKTEDRINQWKVYPGQRGMFAFELYKLMAKDKDCSLITGDLGYKMFDEHKEDMPKQYINCGASEQALIGIACGMALEGKIPFVYSITPFLLYRPFETIRNYLGHEDIQVKLVGSGRDGDYKDDGFSHWAHEAEQVLSCVPNIKSYWPMNEQAVAGMMKDIYENKSPSFISLKR
jgi:transketolase